ncbi:MAG TPA: hypothetical protein VLL52_17280 [Anaerolineae bacterium]|nr:hypothetical protein [Anaerolineae bacterium]
MSLSISINLIKPGWFIIDNQSHKAYLLNVIQAVLTTLVMDIGDIGWLFW